ncbi:excalibur calcium-binding domain-containing protein [Kribbella sp. NPDC023972]|uniref:excalibur calcium-binding domain-containing protein n=1 Tax=Kribbella sp. NPDC023972 TaxID=3154795 RepID=UPI0033E7FE03
MVTVPGPTETIKQPPLPARTITVKAPQATTTVTERAPLAQSTTSPRPRRTTAAPEVYYANCSAVRAAGKAPLYVGQPGYASHLDGDNDGVACE